MSKSWKNVLFRIKRGESKIKEKVKGNGERFPNLGILIWQRRLWPSW